MTRVLGVVMTRNEWPGLGVAITHALSIVDQVLVIDHRSTDDTPAGLRALRREHGDRLSVMEVDAPFWQEAVTNLALALHGVDGFDWVYVFDADELLLLPDGDTLKNLLDRVPASCSAVRYDVQNFVAPFDFDRADITHLERVEHRSLPCDRLGVPPVVAAEEIERGHLNYFDIPFESKVIVRADPQSWIFAGSHRANSGTATMMEHRADPSDLRAAHLQFLGFDALAKKAQHGRRLREQGFPPHHGWQSQMMASIDDHGGLHRFWAAHSIGGDVDGGVDGDTITLPTTVVDPALPRATRAAVAALARVLARPFDDPSAGAGEEPMITRITDDAALRAVRAAESARTAATSDALATEERLSGALAALRSVRRSRDDAHQQIEWLREQLGATSERLHEVGAMNAALEVDAVHLRGEIERGHDAQAALASHLAEVDAHRADLQRELDAMRNTLVWRCTAPLRALRTRLRH